MDFLSFKKLRLFKGQSASPKNHTPLNGAKPEKNPLLKSLIQSPFAQAFVFVLALAYLISYVPSRSLPMPKEGSIASSDITAPADLTIEDAEATAVRRREARDQVLPVYLFDRNVSANTEVKARQFFAAGREWLGRASSPASKLPALQKELSDKFGVEAGLNDLGLLVRLGFPAVAEDALVHLIGAVQEPGVVESKELFIRRESERGLLLIRDLEEKPLQASDLLDVREAGDKLYSASESLDLPVRTKAMLINLTGPFISPNVTFDKVGTDARLERAALRVEPVFYKIKQGKVLVRKGDEVTADVLRQVGIINKNLRSTPSWTVNFAGTFLFLALVFLTMWYYLKSLLGARPGLHTFGLLGIILTFGLLVYKSSIALAQLFAQNAAFPLLSRPESYNFAFPFQFGALIFAFLTIMPVSLIYVIVNSLVVGYLFRADFYLMIFCLIGGLAAMYGVKYFQRQKRTSVLRAGLFLIGPVNVFMVLALRLVRDQGGSFRLMAGEMLMALAGGVLSAALAFVLLPFVEKVFGFVTQPRLLELTNSDTPILKRLALEAPGSYHHSLLVANLAEKAAEAIHLDPLLVKAGGLYHDIGKVRRPEYFIENRTRNVDTHRDLTPAMSGLVIINHVKDGVETARKLHLPVKIREMIEQHHGTSLVRFFYQKAKEKYNPEMHDIGEEQFRYPGPAPQSKEAALIMLADAVEAASKSLRTPDEVHFKRVISAIIDSFVQDEQLDACDFSLKELKAVAASFLETLDSVFHPRVEYPGYDFEPKAKAKPEEKTNGHDRNPEPADQAPGE